MKHLCNRPARFRLFTWMREGPGYRFSTLGARRVGDRQRGGFHVRVGWGFMSETSRASVPRLLRLALIAGIASAGTGCERLPAPTGATGPQVLVSAGLVGTWSFDCASGASRENPYIVYTVPQTGEPAEQFIARDPKLDRVTPLRNIRELEGKLVEWTQRVADKSVTVIVQVEGQRQRLWRSELSDGTIFAASGAFRSGAQTPWFNKCSGG